MKVNTTDIEYKLLLEIEKMLAETERTRTKIILWGIGIATIYSIVLLIVLAKGFNWI